MADSKSTTRVPKGPGGGPGGHQLGFEKPKNTKKTFSRVMEYLKESKLLIAVIVVALIANSGSLLASTYFLKPLINNYIIPADFKGLARGLFFLGLIYLAGIAAAYSQMRFTVKVAQRTTNKMRKDLFSKMQELPVKYFDTHTHGELMSRYTNDIDNVQMMLEQSMTQLVSSVLTFLGVVIMMIILSPLLFLATAVVMALMIIISKKIGGKSKTHFEQQQKILGALNGNIEESISGLKEIKVFNHEEEAKKAFNELNDNYRKTASRASFLAGIIMPIMMNLNNVSYASVAVFGGILTLAGRFDIGSLAAFLQYSRQAGQPINMVTSQINNVLAAMAGAERVFDIMDQPSENDEGEVELIKTEARTEEGNFSYGWAWLRPSTGEITELKGDVRFHNVTFAYEKDKTVLNDVSLYAKPGQTIAFVGSTGAGKTTITNLLNRFYDIQEGTITYDGIDVKDIKKDSLRNSLGMVLQDTHLFTGSILENIRFGRLDATDEECIKSAKAASADSFISRLPEGYHTVISGDGANLSQGQRQLIAITRAYVASPPVMVLDEATSSIDTRTERLIEKGMTGLMKGRTVFVIAHRLSTIRNSDAIMVLEHGQIIERGNHEELLASKGRYYQLYTGISDLD